LIIIELKKPSYTFIINRQQAKDESSFYKYQDTIEQMNEVYKDIKNFNNEVV
jgi:hypothetical protein